MKSLEFIGIYFWNSYAKPTFPFLARDTTYYWEVIFGDRVIYRNESVNWPPKSRDLISSVYF